MRHLTTYRYLNEVAKIGTMSGAAEALSITPSALTRRIQSIEVERGEQIFERLPRGIRLTPAGRVFIEYVRNQLAETERMRSQISEQSNLRRGHVSIACSQGLIAFLVGEQIQVYRQDYPDVTFSVFARDRRFAEAALLDYSCDIAVVFEPERFAELETLSVTRHVVCAIVAERHPLARLDEVRLQDCMNFPIALPTLPFGIRQVVEKSVDRLGLDITPVIESDSFDFLRNIPGNSDLVAFHTRIGLPPAALDRSLTHRPIDQCDVPAGSLRIMKLKGRLLPAAAERFVCQLKRVLREDEQQGRIGAQREE